MITPVGHRIAAIAADPEELNKEAEARPDIMTLMIGRSAQMIRGIVTALTDYECDCVHELNIGQVIYFPENAADLIGETYLLDIRYIIAKEEV